MNILLDTHAIIWFLEGNALMPQTTGDIIRNAANTKYVSVASLWEIAIKTSSGKLTLDDGIMGFMKAIEANGFSLLDIAPEHINAIMDLPFIHRDPFDRMLVAQAMAEDMTIMTIDENIHKYNINTIW